MAQSQLPPIGAEVPPDLQPTFTLPPIGGDVPVPSGFQGTNFAIVNGQRVPVLMDDDPDTRTALEMFGTAQALPVVQRGVEGFATNPNAWRTARAIGEVTGAITGGIKAGPLGVAAGAYAGGKAGYRLSNLAQRAAVPVANVLERVAPYAQALSTLSGAQGVLDLAQMAEPGRQDVGVLGVGIGPSRTDEEKAADPALINLAVQKVGEAIKYLMARGLSQGEATRAVMNTRLKYGAQGPSVAPPMSAAPRVGPPMSVAPPMAAPEPPPPPPVGTVGTLGDMLQPQTFSRLASARTGGGVPTTVADAQAGFKRQDESYAGRLLASPVTGAQRVYGGLQTIGGQLPPFSPTPDPRQLARGTANVLGGAMEAGTIGLPGAIASAPIKMGAMLLSGTAVGTAVYGLGRHFGIPEEYVDLAAESLGLAAGIAAGHVADSPELQQALLNEARRIYSNQKGELVIPPLGSGGARDVEARAIQLYLERGAGNSEARMAQAYKDAGRKQGVKLPKNNDEAFALVRRLMGEAEASSRMDPASPFAQMTTAPVADPIEAQARSRARATAKLAAPKSGDAASEAARHLSVAPVERVNGRLVISVRVPSAVDAPALPPGSSPLTAGVADAATDPKFFHKIAETVRGYPMISPREKRWSDRGVIDAAVNRGAENINTLIEMQHPKVVEEATKWYQGGHNIGDTLAAEVGVTGDQGNFLIASQSPTRDWNQNVELSKRMAHLWKDWKQQDPPFTQKLHDHFINTTIQSAKQWIISKKLNADQASVTMARAAAKIADSARYIDHPWTTLPTLQRARMLRAWSELNQPQSYPILGPSGEIVEPFATTRDGRRQKMVWQSYANMVNGLSILEDPSDANLSMSVGEGQKVRSFANNLNVPGDPRFTTVDTHAVGATHLRPMGGKQAEVKQVMAGPGSASTGLSGLHPIHRDALVLSAQGSPRLPNQNQSVSWETIQGLFSSAQKRNTAFRDAAYRLWQEHRQGRITTADLYDRIFESGIKLPKWFTLEK